MKRILAVNPPQSPSYTSGKYIVTTNGDGRVVFTIGPCSEESVRIFRDERHLPAMLVDFDVKKQEETIAESRIRGFDAGITFSV
jgi:hypothetical protein